MSLDPPAYIASLQNNIRARPISWEGAVRARTITDADLKKIKSIDKVRKEQRKQTIEGDLDSFRKLFIGGDDAQSIFQAAAKREDISQYLLVLLGDLVDDISSFVSALTRAQEPYKPLLPLLEHSSNTEDPIPLLASSALTGILSHAITASTKAPPHIDEALPKLYKYLASLSTSNDSGLQDIAVQQYGALLRSDRSRELFWEQRKETINPLIAILRAAAGSSGQKDKGSDSSTSYGGASSSRSSLVDAGISGGVGIQLLYHVLLVFWQLTFYGSKVGQGLDEEHNIIPLYVQLIRISPKEKITRLLLSTLHNLLSTNQSALLPAAVQARLPALLQNVKGRHVTDPDMLEDLDRLKNMMEEYSKSQTTFDEYAQEVKSGHLRWSPPHRNSAFWKDNARKIIDDNKGELLKKLAEILGKSWESDKQVLAIGCNDVAFLVKEVPEKKQALERIGLKTRVMELMQSDDESVRWESLRAVGEWLRYNFEN